MDCSPRKSNDELKSCFPLGAKIVVWFGAMNIEDTTCSRGEVLKLYLVSFILSFIIMASRSLTGDPSAHHKILANEDPMYVLVLIYLIFVDRRVNIRTSRTKRNA